MTRTLCLISVFALGCSHQTEFYGGRVDPESDAEFQRRLERRDPDVKACYGKVNITDPVTLEMVVDEKGHPLAARATGQLFGSTLGGCLETVAFRIDLPPASGRRIARATAGPHPIAASTVPLGDVGHDVPPAWPQIAPDGGVPHPGQSPR